jgi:folate-binding protein YgfZ
MSYVLHGFPDHPLYLDRRSRTRMALQGDRAREVLNGLITNDVATLAEGTGAYAAALTPKGKLLTDLRIFARGDDLLIDVPAQGADAWWTMVRKYINPRLAKYIDLTEILAELLVFGVGAADAIQSLAGTLPNDAEYSVIHANGLWIARVPDLGIQAFSIFYAPSELTRILERLTASGATEDTGTYAQRARIEAGRPAFGVDMDDSSLVQEAGLDRLGAVSYEKGCYTGQETVARLHFRGHVNKRLMGLQMNKLAPPGALLATDTSPQAGTVTSAVHSPVYGDIALALVRREVSAGGTVRVQWPAGDTTATVVDLPFN